MRKQPKVGNHVFDIRLPLSLKSLYAFLRLEAELRLVAADRNTSDLRSPYRLGRPSSWCLGHAWHSSH